MIAQYVTDSAEAVQASGTPEPKSIWIHGSITYVSTGTDYVAPTPEVLPE
jgi:hypothetical protein